MNPRKRIRDAESGPLALLKAVYRAGHRASLGGPRELWRPAWEAFQLGRTVGHRLRAGFLVAPLYRGLCDEVGDRFATGVFPPFVSGRGHIYVGDDVTIVGRADFHFGATRDAVPELHLGSGCVIGHNASFSVSGRMVLGEGCLVATNVSFTDCNGHSLDPERRRAHEPPEPRDVRDVTIGRNVWIGWGAHVLPGASIGDDCVIAAHARVRGAVPPRHLVLPAEGTIVPLRPAEGPLKASRAG